MNNLTQELTRSGEETNASADIPEQTFQNIRKQCTQNEIGMQENDSEFFIIDVAGQASNGANRSESDEDESDDSRNALDNLFKVDTVGKDGQNDDSDTEYDSDDDNCVIELPLPRFPVVIKKQETVKSCSSSSKKEEVEDYSMNESYLDIHLTQRKGAAVDKEARKFTKVDDVLKKSVITPGFEKLESVPAYQESDRILQKKRKKERERTKGSNWFNMPATELTDELKNDLEILRMRSVLDPKHFYKKNDLKVLPKYFQVGKVLDSPADFYHSRVPKKERKRTIVDELLADSEFKRYNKRRYKEIIEERRKTHYKAHIRAKKLKHKK
ncbi:hypothetical protein Cfor_06018 [Coptotermes formosanus]|uniref:Fcf2 pre-rRNA processing C-terminal domain-containing protein n=1 Tax=Coptotermes formosanus TaxID=36987 RepID=A0A6L2P903_COPFO|nr:hypothetical protein Cfor_06018 [Coptotermes formosanus]